MGGANRSFGKGLVQNVDGLPFNTAMKYTVAKYYTPSGRCIQSVEYKSKNKSKQENSLSSAKENEDGNSKEEIVDAEDEIEDRDETSTKFDGSSKLYSSTLIKDKD